MNITLLYSIMIFVVILVMVWGLLLIKRGLFNNSTHESIDESPHEKDGLPILSRHKRNLENIEQGDNDNVIHKEGLPVSAHEGDDDAQTDEGGEINRTERQQHQLHELWNNTDGEENSRYDSADNQHSDVAENLASESDSEEDLFSSLASATEGLMPVIDSVEEPEFNDNSPILDEHLLAAADIDQNSPLNHAEENVNITLVPKHGFQSIDGQTILALAKQYGLRYGAMNMFHRYENKDGTGILWFSMMGMTKEGITPFDLNSLPTSEFKGLILFLSLPHPKALQGFDSMMSIVGLIAKQLDTQILDENNEPLTRERKQQLRNQVQEYSVMRT